MMRINISAEQMEILKNSYKLNKASLKEVEDFIVVNGIMDNGLSDATDSFEQGWNNAMEYVFDILGIEYNITVERLKKNVGYEFDCDLTEDYKDEDDCDEWGCAFVFINGENDYIGVEYNFCIDNGENSCAIYKTGCNSEGYLATDYDTFEHYEIDFDNENWMEDLENAMCKALIKFHDL